VSVPDPNEIPIDQVSGVEERPQNRREWSGALRSLALPVLVVATIVGVLLWVERASRGDSVDDGGYGIVALPPGLSTTGDVSTDEGDTAPDFVLRTPGGGEVRLSDLRGSPVLVNFWASWCAPCRQEMPDIVRAYDERRDDGFVVIGVNLQENASAIEDFAQEFGMAFPIAIDRTGQVADAWRIGGPIEGIPSSYFLDGDGVVRARVFGPMREETLRENLEKIGL
jgi:peroxiredoxin